MIIVDFERKHAEAAAELAMAGYEDERRKVPSLPEVTELPDLTPFADNCLGVAAFEGEKMLGFLCCHEPWEHAFQSLAKGTFSPIHAHGSVKENRGKVYQRMYQAAAEKWVKKGIAYHSIALYAHEETALSAFFDYGFGRRCADAIRMMEPLGNYTPPVGITFKEEDGKEKEQVNRLHRMLKEHMGKSPCFMGYPVREEEEDTEQLQEEKSGSRFFTAMDGEKVAAYVEVTDRGENFATQAEDMRNICGAYCLPEYRGRNMYQGLLDYMILCLKKEGFLRLGVDYESFNPTANMFWPKYFEVYTKSVVRRIDECALEWQRY